MIAWLAQVDPSAPAEQLSAQGWTVMIVAIGLVCGLTAFCLWRILSESTPSSHHHTPLDIESDLQERDPD